jgi:hypothetical protein
MVERLTIAPIINESSSSAVGSGSTGRKTPFSIPRRTVPLSS